MCCAAILDHTDLELLFTYLCHCRITVVQIMQAARTHDAGGSSSPIAPLLAAVTKINAQSSLVRLITTAIDEEGHITVRAAAAQRVHALYVACLHACGRSFGMFTDGPQAVPSSPGQKWGAVLKLYSTILDYGIRFGSAHPLDPAPAAVITR